LGLLRRDNNTRFFLVKKCLRFLFWSKVEAACGLETVITMITVIDILPYMAVKLNKYHKPRLIEAIVVYMARIDLLKAYNVRSDGNVRAELRELKAAVFANVSNRVITQDTQDILDRPNVGWDDIHKLAPGASWHEEQNPAPPTTPQPQPHAQQTPSQLALEDTKLAKLAYVKATRIAQERTQEAAQEAERIRQDATADSRKAKKEERYGATMVRLGKLPLCPKIVRGEECSGISCEEVEPGFPYEHLNDGTSYANVVRGAFTSPPPLLPLPQPPPRPLPLPQQTAPEDNLERRQAVNRLFTLYESQHVQMMEIRDLLRK
jgi:hypothetical protein